MKTPHKEYTIITTTAKLSDDGEAWKLTVEIRDAEQQQVIGPLSFGELPFTTEDGAHRAGVLLAQHWIDGDDG